MAKKITKKTTAPADPSKELPSLVVEGKKIQLKASDLNYPKWTEKKSESLTHEERQEYLGDIDRTNALFYGDSLSFYYTKDFGWVLLTLHISNASRNQRARGVDTSRSYGRRLDNGQLVTVGRGPHVLREIRVHLKKDNRERFRPFLDAYIKGLEEASSYRDRLSSRRANSRSRGGLPSWF